MSDAIAVRPGNLTAALELRSATPLRACTDLAYTDAGVSIVRNWPRLSSGEELVWEVLGYLNGANPLPAADVLTTGLDTPTLSAVRRILAAEAVWI